MDDLLTTIGHGAASNGLPCALLLYAVYWLNKTNQSTMDSFNKERNERITKLEGHIDACESDRKTLREQLIQVITHQSQRP